MAVGDHSRPRSNAELDPGSYQVVLEIMDRLDAKFAEKRRETREDIDSALKIGLAPMVATLAAVNTRLERGEQRFNEQEKWAEEQEKKANEQDKRLGAHSDTINNAMELVKSHKENCPIKTGAVEAVTARSKKEKEPGVLLKLATNVGLPLLIAAVSPLLAIWVMVQLRLVVFADLTTKPLPMSPPAASAAP